MNILKYICLEERGYNFAWKRKVIKHRNDKGIEKKAKVAECWAKIEEQNEKDKKSVAHSWVFEEINVSPKGCNEKCYISNQSEYSVNCYDKLLSVWCTFEPSNDDSIVLVCKRISVNAWNMRIVYNWHLNYSSINLGLVHLFTYFSTYSFKPMAWGMTKEIWKRNFMTTYTFFLRFMPDYAIVLNHDNFYKNVSKRVWYGSKWIEDYIIKVCLIFIAELNENVILFV